MTTNKISLNDLNHGIVRIPKEMRDIFGGKRSDGKKPVIVNGTPRLIHRCRDMLTGLGKLYTLAGLTGETPATWGQADDTPTLTFCAGAGVPTVEETSMEPATPAGQAIVDKWPENLPTEADTVAAAKALDEMPEPDAEAEANVSPPYTEPDPETRETPESSAPDADLVALGTTRLRELCVDMGLSGYGKLNAADLRMFVTKARKKA